MDNYSDMMFSGDKTGGKRVSRDAGESEEKRQMQTEEHEEAVEKQAVSDELSAVRELLADKYEVVSELGRGAQGYVYYGRNTASGKEVAIKVMRISSLENWKQYDLFHREAEILSSLDIDGVACFYETIEDLSGERPVSILVQEYIEGKSLQTYLSEGRRFRFNEICSIMMQLLTILESLHHHEPPVIHRDVKPSNIILHYDNQRYSDRPKVYLIDFGAVANPQVQDGGSTVTGTYGYMAPEQLIGKPVPASDIYSFAVMAVYLLSGVCPENLEVKDLRLVIDPHLEEYPHAVTVLLRKMLETDVNNRLCDYDVIRGAWNAFEHQKFDFEFGEEAGRAKSGIDLKKVTMLGQNGNIDVWESLSDNKNRSIPWIYRKRLIKDAVLLLMNKPKSDIANKIVSEKAFKHDINDFYLRVFFLIILSIGAVFGMVYNHLYLYAAIFLLLLFVGNATVVFRVMHLYKKISHVFKYGRKSLASVVWVTLLDTKNDENIYQVFEKIENEYNGTKNVPESDSDSVNHNNGYDVRQLELMRTVNEEFLLHSMKWKIVYSFNPPDDESENALYHEYISLEPVELKRGDILPILYEIGKDENGNEYVTSIPYPMPVKKSFIRCQALKPVYMR